jgi:hypothetical protein
MRIEAPVIIFVLGAAAIAPASAQTVGQQDASLPQFVSPAVRDEVVKSAREANAAPVEARAAAEALSAKFADVRAVTDEMPPSKLGGAIPDPRESSSVNAHVAVLVVGKPQAAPKRRSSKAGLEKPKGGARAKQVSTHSRRSASREGSRAGREVGRGGERHGPSEAPERFASYDVPDAATGWRTGLVGFLTNPAFWH